MQKKSKKIKQYNVIEYKIQRELITILKEKEEKKGGNKMQKEKKSRKKQLTERIGIGVAIVVLIVVCIVAKSASSRYANTLPDLSKEKTVYEDKNVGELFNKVEKII